MTQQEFKNLTGLTYDDELFAEIHNLYMTTTTSKELFCKEWVKYLQNSTTILGIMEKVKSLQKELEEVRIQRDDAEEAQHTTQTAMGEWMARKFYETNDEEMRDKAIELLGKKGYITYLLEDDFNLFRQDKLLASELLK